MSKNAKSTFTVVDKDGKVLGRHFTRVGAMHKLLTYDGREYAIRSMYGRDGGPGWWTLWIRDSPSSVPFFARLFGRPKWQRTGHVTVALNPQEAAYKISEVLFPLTGPNGYSPYVVTDSYYDFEMQQKALELAGGHTELELPSSEPETNPHLNWGAMMEQESLKVKKYQESDVKAVHRRTKKPSK